MVLLFFAKLRELASDCDYRLNSLRSNSVHSQPKS